jgi:hypothetical protein
MWQYRITTINNAHHDGVLKAKNDLTEFYKNLNSKEFKFINLNRSDAPESLSLNIDLIVSVYVVPYEVKN